MGSIYQIKKNKRWRVQFCCLGKRSGACFETYEEAKKFHDEAMKVIEKKKYKHKLNKVLDPDIKGSI